MWLRAYSLFYIVGTLGAIQIPVVGMQPLRSLEQMGPLLVFIGYQVLAFCDYQRHRRQGNEPMTTFEFIRFRLLTLALKSSWEPNQLLRMCALTLVALVVVAVP